MTAFYPGRPQIDAYGGGGFRFAAMSHRGSILALPSGVYDWPVDAKELAPGDFSAVFNERRDIDLLLLGMGSVMLRPPRALREIFEGSGIMLDFMTTGPREDHGRRDRHDVAQDAGQRGVPD